MKINLSEEDLKTILEDYATVKFGMPKQGYCWNVDTPSYGTPTISLEKIPVETPEKKEGE